MRVINIFLVLKVTNMFEIPMHADIPIRKREIALLRVDFLGYKRDERTWRAPKTRQYRLFSQMISKMIRGFEVTESTQI